MKNFYLPLPGWLLTLLLLTTLALPNTTQAQTIYPGDSVKLSVSNPYRGQLLWQESANGSTWTDIPHATANNSWVKPARATHYRAKITEDQCAPVYSNVQAIAVSTSTGLTVATTAATNVTADAATAGGTISRLGGDAQVTARGLCWNTSPNPTVGHSKTSEGTGTGAFPSTLRGLTEKTLYYARAYATLASGLTLYGEQVSFTTLQAVVVFTTGATAILPNTATAGGTVANNTSGTITAKGVCWSTSLNPTVADSKTNDGAGAGTFSSALTGLIPETTYYIRAYATTSAGLTVYGPQSPFHTPKSVTVTTGTVAAITPTGASAGGTVAVLGSETITARGVCWNTAPDPTIAHFKTTNGNGTGTFTSAVTGLRTEVTYYLRAYATTSAGITVYGPQTGFTTASTYDFTFTTANASAVTATSASVGVSIGISGFGGVVAARGVCWSTSPLPTITDSKTANGAGGGSYTGALSGLIPATTYQYRAYATSTTGKTFYGPEKSFTTLAPFSITTTAVTAITAATAKSGGTVTITASGVAVKTRGVCVGTTPNPTVELNGTETGSGAGAFSTEIADLAPATLYYARAYATTDTDKAFYGNQITFTTQAPLLITGTTSSPADITLNTAKVSGNIAASGPGSVIDRGICFSTEPNPTIVNNKTAAGSGTGSFTCSLSGLVAGGTFYVRTYATSNSGTTTYGNEVSLTTLAPIKVVTGTVGGLTESTATVEGGSILIDNSTSIKAQGFCWSMGPNPTILSSKSIEDSKTAGNFSRELTGLNANMTYYVRAYATNENDITVYGDQVSFKTLQPFSANIVLAPATAITKTSASLTGSYTYSGNGSIVGGLGITYSTSPNPAYVAINGYVNGFDNKFSRELTGLLPGTTYYVRAYAITSSGLQYSNAISFKTENFLSTITTLSPTEVTSTSARLSMNFTIATGEEKEGAGILVSNKPNVSLDNRLDGSYIGYKVGSIVNTATSSSIIHEGFLANTTYYVRSYIRIKDNLLGYSNEVSFRTPAAPAPTLKVITIAAISNLSATGVSVVGSYSATGGMYRIGFCASTSSMPTVADKVSGGANTNHISIINGVQYPQYAGGFSDLMPSTKYYYRAYASDQAGAIVYGEVQSFTTTAHTRTFSVTTPAPTKVEATTATLAWSVSANVAYNSFERGVCYSLTPNPTTADFKQAEPTSFSVSSWPITGLVPNSTYYVRAYAYDPITKLTHYGNELTFKTRLTQLISLSLIDPPQEVTLNSARFSMTIYGEESYTDAGFCYGTSPNPTVNNTKASPVNTVRYFTNALSYYATVSGLPLGTTYYIRGYARHANGTYVYSNEASFKTASMKVETISRGGTGGLGYSLTNRITNYGNETVVQRGAVYTRASDFPPTLASGYYTFDGTGTGDFSSKITLPSYSTRYHIRAYAKTSSGQVVYGNLIDYTTIADPNPPLPPGGDSGSGDTGGDTGGGDTGGGTPPTGGKRYLIFGRAFGPANPSRCVAGITFKDYKAYSYQFIQGDYSYASYKAASDAMLANIKSKYYGENYHYGVESSYSYGVNANHAVIIEYTRKIPGWDCINIMVTIGYGTSEAEALNNAVKRKNEDVGGKNAEYDVVKRLTW